MILIFLICLLPTLAFAEFDVKVGDIYEHKNGTFAIVTFVSEDKMQFTTDTRLYREREAERKVKEGEQRQLRRDKVMEEILIELKRR